MAAYRRDRAAVVVAVALALATGLLIGCATPYLIPPGSRPLAAVPVAASQDWSRLLPGTWAVRGTLQPQSPAYAGNLIRRAADIAGIGAWHEFVFAPPRPGMARLELRGGNQTSDLEYRIEGNLLAISPTNPLLSHEHWQPNYAGGFLYLRSLADGEMITLAKLGG